MKIVFEKKTNESVKKKKKKQEKENKWERWAERIGRDNKFTCPGYWFFIVSWRAVK